MEEVEINFRDTDLVVLGTFIEGRGRSFDEPAEGSRFDVEDVLVREGGFEISVYNLFDGEALEDIRVIALEELNF